MTINLHQINPTKSQSGSGEAGDRDLERIKHKNGSKIGSLPIFLWAGDVDGDGDGNGVEVECVAEH